MQLLTRGFRRTPPPVATEVLNATQDPEVLHGTIKIAAVAQVVIATAAAIGLIYLLRVVLVTVLFSILLAFTLDPIVVLLAKIRVPRAVGRELRSFFSLLSSL